MFWLAEHSHCIESADLTRDPIHAWLVQSILNCSEEFGLGKDWIWLVRSMSELDRSLTNIDWLISCSKDKQPTKSKTERTHFCGNCLHCSRLKSRSRTPKTPASQSDSPPGPSSSSTPRKPTHSYANIIATAIRKSANQKMTLNEIYASILDTYPYFRNAAAGWKVRLTPTHDHV